MQRSHNPAGDVAPALALFSCSFLTASRTFQAAFSSTLP